MCLIVSSNVTQVASLRPKRRGKVRGGQQGSGAAGGGPGRGEVQRRGARAASVWSWIPRKPGRKAGKIAGLLFPGKMAGLPAFSG